MLLRVSLVREGAVRAVPAAELLQHRLRKTQRPGARGRERGGASSVISHQQPTSDGNRISREAGRCEPAAGARKNRWRRS